MFTVVEHRGTPWFPHEPPCERWAGTGLSGAAEGELGPNGPAHRSTAKAMFTVVRYSLMRSFSTTALIVTTSAPEMPRSVFAASCTAASAALAKLSGDEPMIVITLATSA